jgi:hypothetical protein
VTQLEAGALVLFAVAWIVFIWAMYVTLPAFASPTTARRGLMENGANRSNRAAEDRTTGRQLGVIKAMPVWLVRATWIEDEVEASEQWEVNATTAHEAVKEVTTHIRFHPHHVEAKCLPEEKGRTIDLRPGQARRVAPQ